MQQDMLQMIQQQHQNQQRQQREQQRQQERLQQQQQSQAMLACLKNLLPRKIPEQTGYWIVRKHSVVHGSPLGKNSSVMPYGCNVVYF